MKVLHVSPLAFGRDGVVGGGERYALELARAMAELTPTRLVTFGRPRREHVPFTKPSRAEGAPSSGLAAAGTAPSPSPSPAGGGKGRGVPVQVYRPWRYVGAKRLGPVAPELLREIARADVVHCHQVHTFLADQCVLYGRLLRKPVFLTDHAGGDRHFNRRLRTIEGAAGLLLVSEHNARGFARFREKISVIYGGVDTQRFRPQPVQRRRCALYVGRLIPYKGVHHLIEGVRPETEVWIAGQGYHDAYVRHLHETAQGHNVRFLGPIFGDDLLRAYCLAGVSVLPSVETDLYGKNYPKSEILGLVLLEAMACETPVVCSAIGGMPELVADGETGIVVPPGDSARLGAAVERLLDDTALARRLGEAGRERVLARFTWRKVAERCLAAYAGKQ